MIKEKALNFLINLPGPLINFGISYRIHRLILDSFIGLSENIDLHTPSTFPNLRPASLERVVEGQVPSRSTGRTIVIDDIGFSKIHFQDLRIKTEKEFENYVDKRLYPLVNEAIYDRSIIKKMDDLEINLLEEYVHHKLLLNTSMVSYIDICSWAFRIYTMFLMDGIYKNTGLELRTKEETINIIPNLGTEWIKTILDDKLIYESYKQSMSHYCFIKIYALALKPIIEAITLCIMEENPIDASKKRYINDTDLLEEINYFIDLSKIVSSGKETDEIDKYIRLTRKTLNIPISDIEKIRYNSSDILEDLKNVIKERYQKLINSVDVEEESLDNIGFKSVASYLSKPTKLNNACISMIIDNIKKTPNLTPYISETFLRGDIRFEGNPSIFIRKPDLGYLRYDPWAQVDKMNELGIGDLRDVVGDLTISHHLVFNLIFNKIGSTIMEKKFHENRYFLNNYLNTIKYMDEETQKKVLNWLTKIAPHLDEIEKIILNDMKNKSDLEEIWGLEVFQKYIKTWLYVVIEIAKNGLDFYDKIFVLGSYIHGIS